MLTLLNLSQYRDVFNKEGINGSLLLDLNDETILMELGMKLKLHRLKILRLIDGRESMLNFNTSELTTVE